MLFITESVKTEELNRINNFLNQYEDDAVKTKSTVISNASPIEETGIFYNSFEILLLFFAKKVLFISSGGIG